MPMLWAGTEDSLSLYISQSDWLATSQAQEAHKAFLASMLDSGEERSSPILTVTNGVGIINISGILVSFDSWVNSYMGLLSQAEIQRALMEASGNPDVTSLLLDVTSPGGQVTMTLETARLIKEVDKIKPVYGFAETAASGAYWLISAARKRYISATGMAGSIGVVAQHVEYSERDKKEGVKRKILRTGDYKQLFNSVEPLTSTAETEILKLMFEIEAVFVREVSSNLNLSIAQLEPALEGREFAGQQAVDVGLFDKVDTFQNVLSMITQKEGEGGTQTMKKGKTYQMASAFAGGGETADPSNADADLKAAEEAAALLKADADLKATEEAAAALLKAGESVVDPNIALLAEKDEEISVLSELAGKLSAVVAKAVGNMCIALNTENPLKEGAKPNEVLAAYSEKAELFVALCPTGGVASVGEDEEKPKVAAPSRFEAAQRKQVVVPRSG